MRSWFFIVFLLTSFCAKAHEPDQAFFDFQEEEGTVVVTAEFPWTMRNALLAYQPSLEKATTQAEFEQALFDYCKDRLYLVNTENEAYILKSVKPAKVPSQHSHGHTFEMRFEGKGKLSQIHNRLMTDHFREQQNFNRIFTEKDTLEGVTSKVNPIFEVRKMSAFQLPWVAYPLGLGLLVLLLRQLFPVLRKKTS